MNFSSILIENYFSQIVCPSQSLLYPCLYPFRKLTPLEFHSGSNWQHHFVLFCPKNHCSPCSRNLASRYCIWPLMAMYCWSQNNWSTNQLFQFKLLIYLLLRSRRPKQISSPLKKKSKINVKMFFLIISRVQYKHTSIRVYFGSRFRFNYC